MPIKRIDQDTIQSIERKTAKTMPDDPSRQGYTPDQIKRRLYSAITDPNNSLVSEINRIVDEINQTLQEIGESMSVAGAYVFGSIEEAEEADIPDGYYAIIKL
jgi:hypothetical protein